MAPLNFPCPSCGAMVSTVGLSPGTAPFCSGCGRTFPLPATASPQMGSPARSGVAGCGVAVISVIAIAAFVGFALSIFTGRSSMARHQQQAQEAAQSEAKRQNYARAKTLAAQLADPDVAKSMQAWHGLAGCDAIDHWGTFDVLDEEFSRTHARNALWNISNGMQMYYGQKGEDAIARELIARKASDEEVDLLCQSLEQYSDSVAKDVGAAQGNDVRTRAWHVLTKAEAMVDHPGATRRIGLALERVRSKLPAEKR